MIKTLTILSVMMISSNAIADPRDNDHNHPSRAIASAVAVSGAVAKASNKQSQKQSQRQGQRQGVNIEDNSVNEATKSRDNTPSLALSGLVASTGSCLGSSSASISVPGFGFGAGGTKLDNGCDIRYNSIRLAQLGMDEAAVAIMCQSESAKIALEETGYLCGDGDNKPVSIPATSYTSSSNLGGGFLR